MNWRISLRSEKETVACVQNGMTRFCTAASRFLTGVWVFLMLAVFPLYVKDGYRGIGEGKYRFFLAACLYCLLPAGICGMLAFWGKEGMRGLRRLSVFLGPPDRAMLAYLAVSAFSWYMSVDRKQAWLGADGWFMGLSTQALLVLSYFLVSRCFSWNRVVLWGYFLGSGTVFLLGILHRFGIDPLGLYEGVDAPYRLLFLSTVGQASWYSSYVCVVLTLGVSLFLLGDKTAYRLGLGAFCMLGFSTLVTQNSDSAFAATAFLLFGVFLAACDSLDGMERFLELTLLMLGSFKVTGILQMIFADRAVRLGGLSEFLSQGFATWFAFLAVCVVYMFFLYWRKKNPDRQELKGGRFWRKFAAGTVAAAVLGYVGLLWMNTAGVLEKWFGSGSRNQYLLFDQYWGNSRGFTWKFAVEAFGAFPFFRKLFGVGPDCFSAYCYQEPALGAALNHYFGWDQTLTNAHNEFLNILFCMGIMGLAAFVWLLAAAFRSFWEKRKTEPLALTGILVVMVYSAHNFFCYQQVCCTPFLFLFLGAACRPAAFMQIRQSGKISKKRQESGRRKDT